MIRKKSEYIRYDKKSKLWIAGRYVMYAYWYKCLGYAELDSERTVNWGKYVGWGGPSVVLNTRFEKWWDERWTDLFGVVDQFDNSKYPLSSNRYQATAIKVAIRVYESRHLNDNYEIFQYLRKKYPNSSMKSIDANAEFAWEKKEVNRTINRYLKQANKMLDNVCMGKFP